MEKEMKTVGIVCDRRVVEGMPMHTVNDEYIAAIRDGARALPLLIPSTDTPLDVAAVLAAVDGLLFTGAPSNVAPRHYGKRPRTGTELDDVRDATTLPLLRAAIAAGKPLLAICRGFQELNVALGGSLHQQLHELPGSLDHREPQNAPSRDAEYAPAHKIAMTPDGVLAKVSGMAEVMVNSLHHQGIDRLAPGLTVEAVAPDGQIEAVSMPQAKAFVLGVQWHPEWDLDQDRLSHAIFAAFGGSF
jgi:putative glutamine amidotransferase